MCVCVFVLLSFLGRYSRAHAGVSARTHTHTHSLAPCARILARLAFQIRMYTFILLLIHPPYLDTETHTHSSRKSERERENYNGPFSIRVATVSSCPMRADVHTQFRTCVCVSSPVHLFPSIFQFGRHPKSLASIIIVVVQKTFLFPPFGWTAPFTGLI